MKWLNANRMNVVIVGIVAIMVVRGGNVRADFTFGEAVNLGPTVNTSSPDVLDCISSDGLAIYLDSDRPGGYGLWDIWLTTREAIGDDWGAPVNLGPPINTNYDDAAACISSDGLELYFQSNRPGGYGGWDIWKTTRETSERNPEGYWSEPQNLGPLVNSSYWDGLPWLSFDGLELYYYSRNRTGGYGHDDIWISRRETINSPWEAPINLGPVINSSASESCSFVSSDGLLLLLCEDVQSPLRPGGFGNGDIWLTRRASVNDPWSNLLNLGPMVNTSSYDGAPRISPDGSMLYFCSERPGGFGGEIYGDIYQAPIIPIMDFNGDGNIDTSDMVLLIDGWGTDDTLYDIGPMPWGDGVVDVEDLIVFMKYWEQENISVNPQDN